MTFADKILAFFRSIKITTKLPNGVQILNPYKLKTTFSVCELFYQKFYADNNPRAIILGINPGRLGGGLTGIPFTDPIKLHDRCGIENQLPKHAELSADFIHHMIDAFGGLGKFYSQFYFSSVSPLGFTKDGKNLNYYDIPELQKALKPFIVKSIQTQLAFGLSAKTCYILGEGKNFNYVQKLNEEYQLFERLIPLPHPRFIMQYKRKQLSSYVKQYLHALES
jgi:hypothetical protein